MKIESINKHIEKNLTLKRQAHIKNVTIEAVKLAKIYGVDEKRAEVAALCHDIMRIKDVNKLNDLVKKFKLPDKYLNNPQLAHSKVGVEVLKREFNLQDEEILDAVEYHTTGREKMSSLEKIVYLADAIEPNRKYKKMEEIRAAAYRNLDEGCTLALKNTINFLEKNNRNIDPDTIKAIEWLQNGGKYE